MTEVPLDMHDVGRCAWGEILQTAPRSTSLFAFMEDLLEPGPNLIWRKSGPGRGTEMRRSFSGLFGRFFARAYLQVHHEFSWFAAIDGDDFSLSPSWRVKRKPGSKTEMPDWICARPGELAIGEAKGSHQKSNATGGGMPGPIKTADGQIRGVRVEKRSFAGMRKRWSPKRVKGWAVMSRWGTADPPREPFLYALDPETEGDKLSSDELDDLIQAVARTHVKQTAFGLGLLKTVEDDMKPIARRRVRVADDQEKRTFAGAIITPFGPLDLDFDRARELAALLPNPDMVRFIGLEDGLFDNFLAQESLVPGQRQQIGDHAIVGSDGLVVASIRQIIDLGFPET